MANSSAKKAAKTVKKVKLKVKTVAKPAKKPVKAAAKPAAKPAAHKPVAAAHKPAAVHKPAKPVAAHKPAAAPAKPASPAPAPVAKAAPAAAPKKVNFKVNELVVYPAHGVGKITDIEVQEIAGLKLELFVVYFEKEKLRLKVPTDRAEQKGMRHLADRAVIEQAMKVIRGRARIKRTMWSRRAQEYDAKINSGDLISVAEVVRDLYRSDRQPEQSYSERQLFEQALARFARELAAVRKVDEDQCVRELEEYLARNAKRGAAEKGDDDSAEEAA
ncbi:MAG: CarD family transcriptional regulator [Alphaproteobacteria bacterium]|nr:CarD family transcriptional regulator [Alphaproteobacteria bacterium]